MYQNIYYQREKNLMHLWDDERGYMAFPYKRYAYAKAKNGEALSIYGDRLTKIYKFKKDDSNLFESDVPETTRALVDLYTDSDDPSTGHVILTFDIEVEMESGLPDPLKGENEITAIGLHDNVSDHYWVLVLDKEGKMKEIKRDGMTVVPFSDERDMLKTYLNIYEEINPTIVTGWNSDYFDTPFLYNRIRNLFGESMANRLSPIGEVFFSPYRNRFFIAGVSYLDYLTLYRKFTYSELDNYRLDTVGQIELDEGKVEYDGSLDDLYREDVDKFIYYNLVDVKLVVKLERKLQFIDLARGICHAGRVPYEDFVYSSKYLEGAILAYLKQKGLVAPNKPADRQERMDAMRENKEDKFIGAFVKDPIVGKYDWIYDLDLTSLYPSIIMSLNISPECKVAKVDGWNAEDYIKGRESTYYINGEKLTRDGLQRMLDENDYSISSNGVLYRQDVVGCIPAILDMWFNRRTEFRKLERQFGDSGDAEKYAFYKKRQLVQKILLNSLYGVLGLPSWRWYDVDNAEAVTTSGRMIIQSTASMGNLKYNKEIGGNPLILELEDETEVEVYPNSLIKIKRGNMEKVISAKDLGEGDDFIEKIGTVS